MYKLIARKVSINVNAHVLGSEIGFLKLPMFLAKTDNLFQYRNGVILLAQNSIENKRLSILQKQQNKTGGIMKLTQRN